MSSGTSANSLEWRRCHKCPNGYQKLWTSTTAKNPNRKFWKCKDCLAFDWDDDDQWVENEKSHEPCNDILLGEIQKLIRDELGIENLVSFKNMHQK